MNKLIHEEVKYDGVRFNVVQKKYLREDGKEIIISKINGRVGRKLSDEIGLNLLDF